MRRSLETWNLVDTVRNMPVVQAARLGIPKHTLLNMAQTAGPLRSSVNLD